MRALLGLSTTLLMQSIGGLHFYWTSGGQPFKTVSIPQVGAHLAGEKVQEPHERSAIRPPLPLRPLPSIAPARTAQAPANPYATRLGLPALTRRRRCIEAQSSARQ
jgi:hypothetical protein